MSNNVKRGAAAAVTFAIAAAVNIATGMVTQRWSLAWVLATVAFVLVGGALQWWLSVQGGDATQKISGTKVGGSVTQRSSTPASQAVLESEVGRDLSQEQG
ncbi:hypothetical protein [Nocardia sp. NPDC051981]|uniref:hypothetical protein n=1 Tax=Nocardia sp. NPDC051981 TaxID=3155417 RepID=UPI0034217128